MDEKFMSELIAALESINDTLQEILEETRNARD